MRQLSDAVVPELATTYLPCFQDPISAKLKVAVNDTAARATGVTTKIDTNKAIKRANALDTLSRTMDSPRVSRV
jgi:hypothetical protein